MAGTNTRPSGHQRIRRVRFARQISFYRETLVQGPPGIGDPQRTQLREMKMNPSTRRRSPLRGGIRKQRSIPSASRVLALLVDGLERAMPDMAQIGVGMLVVVACVASGWIDMGMDETSMLALQEAQAAAVAGIPGYTPF